LRRIHSTASASSRSSASTAACRRPSTMCRSIQANPPALLAAAYGSSFSHRGTGGSAPSGRAVALARGRGGGGSAVSLGRMVGRPCGALP